MGQAKRRGSREDRIMQAVRLKDEGIETTYWKLKREGKERKEMIQQRSAEQKKMLELMGMGIGIKPTPGFTPNHPLDPNMIRINAARQAFLQEQAAAKAQVEAEKLQGNQPVAMTEAVLPLDKSDLPLLLDVEQTGELLAAK